MAKNQTCIDLRLIQKTGYQIGRELNLSKSRLLDVVPMSAIIREAVARGQ